MINNQLIVFHTENFYITAGSKLSEIILANPYLILMLEHFGIEFPIQEKTISEICNERSINTELFLTFANLYNGNSYSPSAQFSFSDIYSIINYLKHNHKYYMDEIYPAIMENIRLMGNSNNSKEMSLVREFFDTYFNEVKEHLEYENTIVFPYMMDLYNEIFNASAKTKQNIYSVKHYKDQHDDIEEKLDDLRNLIIKYLSNHNDQSQRRRLLLSLYELEFDLNIHSQIEDLILIPLVARAESQLSGIN